MAPVTEGVIAPTQTWYEQRGEQGPALVLVPGGPGAASGYLAPLAERLGRTRRVVRYDPAGTGRSRRDRPAGGWRQELFLAELAALRDQLGLDQVDLLGHSWGGWLALDYALAGAPGVRSLILYSTSASVPRTIAEQRRLVATLPPEARDAIVIHEQRQTYDSEDHQAAVSAFMRRHFCRVSPWPAALSRQGFNDDLYQSMWGPSEITCTGTLADWDVTPRLGEIAAPVLVIAGAHDQLTPALQAELVRGLPDAQQVTLADSSHTGHLEEPERFERAVAGFLDSLVRAA